MELKSLEVIETTSHKSSSNRTFMELKLFHVLLVDKGIAVLIAPLWN